MIRTTLCYLYHGDSILMLYRNKKDNDFHLGKWNGLGGKIEAGETSEEGVVREVYEESGIKITNPTLIGECSFPNFEGQGEDEYMYIFIAQTSETKFENCLEGDLHWIKEDKILSLNLWESDLVFLPYVFKKIPFRGSFCFKGKTLLSHELEVL